MNVDSYRGIWNEKSTAFVRQAMAKPMDQMTDAEVVMVKRWLKDHSDEEFEEMARGIVGND